MGKFDQAKMLMKVKKMQKELAKEVLTVSAGDDAVIVEITGEQKIKKITIDPERIDLDDMRQTEKYVEEAVKQAISDSQRLAAEKMQPFMGMLGDLGF